MEKHKIPYFLTQGTLIGALRNHPPGMNRFDDDLDLGALETDYERLHEALSQDPRLDSQHSSYWDGFKYGLSKMDDNLEGKYNLDIFRYELQKPRGATNGEELAWFVKGNRLRGGFASRCYYDQGWLNSTVPCQYWDLTVQCPEQSRPFLELCFGSNWMELAITKSHRTRSRIVYNIELDKIDMNDRVTFIPGLDKALRDKLLPNPNTI